MSSNATPSNAMSSGPGASRATTPSEALAQALAVPSQLRRATGAWAMATEALLGPAARPGDEPRTLAEAEAARDRAMCRLRDAEHWRRLVAARLDLAVAAVADIDDLEATLVELRPLIGMPGADGRLAESSLLIRLRAALGDLDGYIAAAKSEVDDATARVAACIVHEAAQEQLAGHADTAAR